LPAVQSGSQPEAAPALSPVNVSISPEGMVNFEGDIFVASTNLVDKLWQMAGWRIGDQPVDTDGQDLPADCTLYPHLGVDNQWVGRCKGNILVPQAGAKHIAVVITHPDGSTTMVQVAPPPDNQ
jgi:hypothetical protein